MITESTHPSHPVIALALRTSLDWTGTGGVGASYSPDDGGVAVAYWPSVDWADDDAPLLGGGRWVALRRDPDDRFRTLVAPLYDVADCGDPDAERERAAAGVGVPSSIPGAAGGLES
jgi:hypothetical protein